MNKLMLLKVFDSRGNETIEATMLFKNNSRLSSIAPAGKSTGIHEVGTFPLTNGKPDINKSIEFFNLHKNKIEDAFEFDKQKDFDDLLKSIDGTNNLSNIGGSLSISLSMLFLKYKAYQKGLEIYEYLNSNAKEKDIPKALGNVLGGGLHSNNKLPVQELLVTHVDVSPIECIKNNIIVYHELESLLKQRNMFFAKNDEGAISTNISFRDALYLIEESKKNLKLDTKIGMDVAANSFYKDGEYYFEGNIFSEEEFEDYFSNILSEFDNIIYIEDPFDEESFEAFASLQKHTNAYVCGDDLYTTNVERIKKGINAKSTKAVLIKPNQIGTITDTFNAVKIAKDNSLIPVISHRSGETSDNTIAHLAVGWSIPFIKTGTVSGERLAKLNELIYIYNKLKN